MRGFIALIIILLIISCIFIWYNQTRYSYNDNFYYYGPYEPFNNVDPVTVGTLAEMQDTLPNKSENNMPAFTQNDKQFKTTMPRPTSDQEVQQALELQQSKALTTLAYPMFSDSLPVEDISPAEDMTYVSDKYLKLNKNYKFDGNKLVDFPGDYFLLDDGANGNYGGANNICSKSCCAPQWPVPFKTSANESVCNGSNIVGTNYMCNSTFQNSGCLCMTKEQVFNISTRGGNAGKDVFVY